MHRKVASRTRQAFAARVCALAAAAALLPAARSMATTYYVDVNWGGPYNGTTTEPYRDITTAVGMVRTVGGTHTINIADGVYKSSLAGGNETFEMVPFSDLAGDATHSITIKGGYVGTTGGAPDWTEGTRVLKSTVIDLAGATARAFYADDGGWTDNRTLNLSGVTIRNASHAGTGGALVVRDQGRWDLSCTISDCLFTNNAAASGGAVWAYVYGAAKMIQRCVFVNNQATTGNGGAFRGGMTIEDCIFSNNTAAAAAGEGGAVTTPWNEGSTTIRRCVFRGNQANKGGAINNDRQGLTVEQCRIYDNRVTGTGRIAAAVKTYVWTTTTLRNCLIYRNTGAYAIEGQHTASDAAYNTIDYCTIADNSDGGIHLYDGAQNWINGELRVRNSIVANNSTRGIWNDDTLLGASYTNANVLLFNDVFGHTANYFGTAAAGAGSISASPSFVDAANRNYHLNGGPCVSAGTNISITVDLDGTARVGYDMGCYEAAPVVNADVKVATGTFVSPTNTGVLSVDGVGFQPKAILLWGVPVTNEAVAANAAQWIGFADDNTPFNQRAVAVAGRDGSAATRSAQRTNAVLRIPRADSDAALAAATLDSYDAQGFNLNFSATAPGYVIHYVAFGGAGLEAQVGHKRADQSPVSGLELAPDLVFAASAGIAAATSNAVPAVQGFGCFSKGLQQWWSGTYQGNNDTANKDSVVFTNAFIGELSAGSVSWTARVTSVTLDGFAWAGSSSDVFHYLALAMPAVKSKVGLFTKDATGAAPASQELPELGFTPKAFGLVSAGETNEVGNTPRGARLAMGAFDGQRQNAVLRTDQTGAANADQRGQDDAVLEIGQADAAVSARATALTTADSTPTLTWNPNDTAPYVIGYWAVEDPYILGIRNLAPTGITQSAASFRGYLDSTGGSPAAVRLYWGQADPGPAKSGWAFTNAMGYRPVGLLATNLNVVSNRMYYYRYYATNSLTEKWSTPAQSFMAGRVWIVATQPGGAELGQSPARFTISRPATATNGTLTVNYRVAGSATNGTDYQTIGTHVVLTDGVSSVTITITPTMDWYLTEGNEQVQITLATGLYAIAAQSNATLTITNYPGSELGSTLYVDQAWTSVAGYGLGTATNPFNSFSAAVSAINQIGSDAKTLLAADGMYQAAVNGGRESFGSSGILLTRKLTVRGGYAGWTAGTAFDWTARLPRSTVVDLTNANARAFNVVYTEWQSRSATFDGLTFRNANHAGPGGAVNINAESWGLALTLQNCLFANNRVAGDAGAAVFAAKNLAGIVTNCTFTGNRANGNGGALLTQVGDSTAYGSVVGSDFSGNSAGGNAGAVYMLERSIYVRRCAFTNNTARYGGVATAGLFDRCRFVGNSCAGSGPAGAALYVEGSMDATLQNCLICGNTGGFALDGLYRYGDATFDVTHCTITANPAGGIRCSDGGFNWRSGSMRVRNSVVATNGSTGIDHGDFDPASADVATLQFNDVWGQAVNYANQAAAGTGSISRDPRFDSAAAWDYHIPYRSPCANKAVGLGVTVDLDGRPRPDPRERPGAPDMGCYEAVKPDMGAVFVIR